MKMIKLYIVLFAMMVMTASNSMAQRNENFSELVTRNIVESLKHDIEGVVEASIYNSIFLTKYYPEAKIDRVLNELNNVVVNSSNPVLRYKAQLAVLFISNYSSDELNMDNFKDDQTELFRVISEKLQDTFLVSSNK
ncbi:MAG TPA: hypothetical protein ENN33_07620 [Ignavibacteria bacterium]|nr:hypothetical protein [Ignavibacteria bacterium]